MIAVLQVVWFLVNCIIRVAQHLVLTTLELTTLSFILIFFATSFCWKNKPKDISRAIILTTITTIRSKYHSYPEQRWYQTPLDFLSRDEWVCGRLWRFILRYCTICTFQSLPDRTLNLTIISLPISFCDWIDKWRVFLLLYSSYYLLVYSYWLGISNFLPPRKDLSGTFQQSIKSYLVLPAGLVSGMLIQSFFPSSWKRLSSLNTHHNGNSFELHGN